ncbi:MAG TPA: TRAP transporter small permease subunit [Thermococcus sp.]|nr:TRAP transporter small permease subunit [Thermococcus sp.]
MQKILQIIDVISLITGKIVSFLILIIVGITVYEVILRYVFNSPTTWAFELNYLIFGAYSILGGAYTFYLKGHVNVDILYGRLSLKKRAVCDLITSVFFFIFCGVLLWNMGIMAWDSLKIKEHLSSAWAPPIYHLKVGMFIGVILLFFQGLSKFIRDWIIVLTGKDDEC